MMKWLGVVSMVCFAACYVPQLARTFRTRSVEGMSTAYWTIVTLGYVSGVLYVLPLNDPLVTLTYAIGLVCATAMLGACITFRRRSQNEK